LPAIRLQISRSFCGEILAKRIRDKASIILTSRR
jgi:hypothetical protein